MQSLIRILALTLLGLAPVASICAQSPTPAEGSAQSAAMSNKRTDVYHVFFVKAALGKAAELADFLKQPDPNSKDSQHRILLRHQDGDEWDYVEIQHIGTKATVENPATPMPDSARGLMEKHNDTFVNGPSWAEFAKEMGVDGDASKTAGSVYSVSVYRAAPGHRDALEKMLSEPPNRANDTSSGNVLMAHLEGAAWNFLSVARYDSWEKFASNETKSVAQTNKKEGGWFELRNHVSYHTDTLTDRILP
ncbi:MAG: hypothetical protein ACR2II_00990 [Chthoniobacterales bacterium]